MEIPTTLLLTLGLLQGPSDPQPIKDLVHVPIASAEAFQQLHQFCTDVDDHHATAMAGYAVVFATDAEQDALAKAGIAFTVEQEDLQAFYAQRAAADLAQMQSQGRGTGAVVGGSMGGFKTLAEIETEMDRLAATYPLLCSPKFVVGTSLEGRSIYGMRLSTTPGVHDPQKAVAWFDAIHHSREPMSGESQLLFADELLSLYGTDAAATRILETRNVVIIPCVNPDGYEFNRQIAPGGGGMWRKNRRDNGDGTDGVDLNRNYDWEWGPQWQGSSSNPISETYRGTAPFSEPETTDLMAFMATMPPGMSMSSHTFSNLMLYPWGYNTIVTPDDAAYRQYGSLFTADNGWPRGTIWEVLYIANGGSVDFHYGTFGTLAFTPEIGSSSDGFWPAPSRIPALYQEIRPSYFGCAQYTGAWAEVTDYLWTEVSGDGDAWQEPGESWSLVLEVTNTGLETLDLDLLLSSSHPDVAVSGLPGNLVLAERTSGQSQAFQVDFGAAAPVGAPLNLDLSLDFDS
ncbi:MAG: M14 family metallopeptidase, partial [Planctomycetota bacterium]